MISEFNFSKTCGWALLLVLCSHVQAATPTAVINASPSEGRAPLGVLFDSTGSSADSTSFLWNFGDGGVSTAKSLTHIYTVAGTYIATLTVTNDAKESASSQVTIVVTGSGEGPVTSNMNFRWAIQTGNFKLKHNAATGDSLNLTCAFNTVDLPGTLQGLAANFSINNTFTVSGFLGPQNGFQNADKRKPEFFVEVSTLDQTLNVFIAKADLKAAFAPSGAANVSASNLPTPVTFTLTIGSQTYSLTETFLYTSTAGASGRGQFNLKKGTGTISDGFFLVTKASAVENQNGTGHFFEFDGLISQPTAKQLQILGGAGAPVTKQGVGTNVLLTLKFNESDPVVLLPETLRMTGTKIVYDQTDRDLGQIRHMTIDVKTRLIVIKTWDILANFKEGGTDLPLRGKPFTAFNFAVRLDLAQADGTLFQAVTATRLTRKTTDDAFWQTGRRGKKQ